MSIYSVPEQILESVQRDIRLYENYLKKVATRVIAEEISKYPIFIVHKELRLELGRPIIVAEAMQTDWSINASLIEEFIKKNMLHPDKVKEFKQIYKDPERFICLFIISGNRGDATFAFYPYHG